MNIEPKVSFSRPPNRVEVNTVEDLREWMRHEFAQTRICKKLEPIINESNFMVCLKKMFNKKYEPELDYWWIGSGILDARLIRDILMNKLDSSDIGYIDIFVKLDEKPVCVNIFVLVEGGKYIDFNIGG